MARGRQYQKNTALADVLTDQVNKQIPPALSCMFFNTIIEIG